MIVPKSYSSKDLMGKINLLSWKSFDDTSNLDNNRCGFE